MAKEITVITPHNETIEYTMVETVEDLEDVFTFGDLDALAEDINNGKIVLINRMGGFCHFMEGYHTIVNQ